MTRRTYNNIYKTQGGIKSQLRPDVDQFQVAVQQKSMGMPGEDKS